MNIQAHPEPERRPAGFFQTLKTVAWGFFGIRRGKDHVRDTENLNPVHLIAMGLFAALIFVVGLIFIARLFVANLA
jgi:hypothetical protein